ncbi:MAG: fibronectin type III domain-containing protein [Eubacteriales bacterium]|nr:fibronectin type III domain-containing protein [Eubacteriales bacterium]
MGKVIANLMKRFGSLSILTCLVVVLCMLVSPTTARAAETLPHSENPMDINLDTEYVIEANKFRSYYSFELKEASRVNITASSSSYFCYYVSKDSSPTSADMTESDGGEVNSSVVLPKGEYYLITLNRNSSLNIKLTATPYKWGTLKLNSFNNGKFTVTYTPNPNNADDKNTIIYAWAAPGYADFTNENSQKFTGYMDKSTNEPGHTKITITVRNDKLDLQKDYTVDAIQLPKAPKYSANCLENVNTNSAIIGGANQFSGPIDRTKNGNYYKVQILKAGKWTTYGTYSAGEKAKITKLKPNTEYKIRLIGVLRTKGYKDIESAPSKAVKFRTGCKEKPAIKSIKVTNVKVKKIPKVYHPGTWVGTVWRDGYYTGGYTETSFNATVTLKKRVKGPAGLNIDGVFVKGSGTTFSTKGVIRGNYKGKKYNFNISYANHKLYGGLSPKVKKAVTMK